MPAGQLTILLMLSSSQTNNCGLWSENKTTCVHVYKIEAIKALKGCRALHCNKNQFRNKMTVSIQTVFEISLLNIVVLTRKDRRRKMTLSLPHTFAYSYLL